MYDNWSARSKLSLIINLPISHCTNQHGTPRAGQRNDRRCYPIAYCKHGINYGQTDISITGEIWVIDGDAIEYGFLRNLTFKMCTWSN